MWISSVRSPRPSIRPARSASPPVKIFEHIHGAACGAWWTSTLCADGTPNGYGVYEISGSTVPNQYYKATNKAADHQIRAYSAKQVFGTSGSTTFGFAANASAMNDAKCIVANVWNSDTGGDWKNKRGFGL